MVSAPVKDIEEFIFNCGMSEGVIVEYIDRFSVLLYFAIYF